MPAPPTADLDPPLPRELQVEITGACNLRCKMCLVRYRPPVNRIAGSFTMDAFRRLVDGNLNLEQLTLQGLGEPLLAPDLFEMIEYASGRGLRVGFNTNGTLLTRERAERLVRCGLSWLYVSVDGATAESYEGIRDGADFAKVVRNIEGLADVKRRLGADRPHVRLVFVAMRRNVAELPALVERSHDWGVDEIWVQNLAHDFSDTDPGGEYASITAFAEAEALWAESAGHDRAGMRRAFDDARAAARRFGVELRLPRLEEPVTEPRSEGEPGCDWPWRSAYVTYEGVVQPCCMVMGSDRAQLGRLDEASFEDIWLSQPYVEFRRALCSDEPPDVCRGCSMYRHTF